MKNILYIGGFEMPDKNAAAQRVMANALLLRDMGYSVSFIGPTKDRSKTIPSANGFSFEYLDYPKSITQWLKYITTFITADRILSYKPDFVVLYNFPSIASLKILRLCHKHGIKVIHDLTEWESAGRFSPREVIHWMDINLRMRYCMKKMDGVIAISRYLYDYYKPYTNVALVPPTVDLQNEKWDRNRHLTTGGRVQLVYAGSSGANKDRLDRIIEVVKRFSTMDLNIIGLTKEQYKEAYKIDNVDSDNIHFYGRVSHAEAVRAVQNADFQMLIRDNTLKNKAGFPTKFVESMSCCTPLIATRTSNICDYLTDGINGFVVDENQDLFKVLSRVLALDKSQIISMKQNCKDFQGFDYRNYQEELSKLFE